MNSFSRTITLLRKEAGLTQKKAAADLGVSQALLSHYEKGLRECGLDFLIKLCNYYNVSADYILGRSPDRNGTILNVEDFDVVDNSKDAKFTGSVLPVMNKRLIFSSLNVIYDLLTKVNSKDLTNSVSNYFSLAVYRMFRSIYQSEKKNTQNMFDISSDVYPGYAAAAMEKTNADINAMLNAKGMVKARGDSFVITMESLEKDYPKSSTGLTNTLKNAEEAMK